MKKLPKHYQLNFGLGDHKSNSLSLPIIIHFVNIVLVVLKLLLSCE